MSAVSRRFRLIRFLTALFLLSGCHRQATAPHAPEKWSAGFWFWNGSSASIKVSGGPVDVLFCHVGTIEQNSFTPRDPWNVSAGVPDDLPPAKEYWLVYRFNRQSVPSTDLVPKLSQSIAALVAQAREHKLPVAGVQLDIDSPTRALPEYARFLHEVRGTLPPGVGLSITALLDWFRAGTAIRSVLEQVDEYVPQFYDVQDINAYQGGSAIAAPLDGAKWNTLLTPYQKRFRLGISAFGRTRFIPKPSGVPRQDTGIRLIGDLKQLDVAIDPAFTLEVSRTAAQELALTYRANRETRVGYDGVHPGDAVQFILSTPESIQSAVTQARQTGPYCAGIVFFRWPASNETLAPSPGEVLADAGLRPPLPSEITLRAADGSCAAVHCVDLYLVIRKPLSAQPLHYRVRSSESLEYFLPYEKVPVQLAGSQAIEIKLPPYHRRSRLYLGRAVALRQSEYKLEELLP